MKVLKNREYSKVVVLERKDLHGRNKEMFTSQIGIDSFSGCEAYKECNFADAVFFKDIDGSITVLKDRNFVLV